jgi:O-antigen/teichoic acid export membrane protein
MAIARKLAYNVVFNSALKVVSTVILSLFLVRLITGYLGQDGFGKYATVLAFFSFFSAIGDLGLGQVTAREIAKEGADERNILGNVVGLRLVSSMILIVVAPIAIFFFDYPVEVKWGILIVSCASLFSSLSLVMNGVFRRIAMIGSYGELPQLIQVSASRFLPIVFSVLIALAFNVLTVLLVSRRFIRFSLRFDFSFWRGFLKESLPMGATAIITFAYFKTDTILLSLFQTSADVGVYNVASTVLFFPGHACGISSSLACAVFRIR